MGGATTEDGKGTDKEKRGIDVHPTSWGPQLFSTGPILSVFPALIVHSELKSVHPGFPVAFIFKHKLINK